jgi:GNAT superfamily N-acetyltransferase
MDDLLRLLALERRLLERLSTRIEPFEHGDAFFDDENRRRYVSNFLLAERDLAEASAGSLLEAADRILGGAGFEHRAVVVTDDEAGGRFVPAFAEHGYAVDRNLLMIHAHDPDRGSALDVQELSFAEVRSVYEEVYRRTPWAAENATDFTDQHGKYERVIGARFFAVRIDGELAGKCELYVDGADAQIENVDTLEEFRGRGVARAVVLRAADVAREAGASYVFIVADDADWPKELYARLGFEAIGRTWEFLRGRGIDPARGNPGDPGGAESYSIPPTHP